MIGLQTMVRCSCGKDNLERKFCTDCSQQLLYDCGKCKKVVAATEKFCETCSTKNLLHEAKAYNTCLPLSRFFHFALLPPTEQVSEFLAETLPCYARFLSLP